MTNQYRAEYAGRSRLSERLQRLNKPLHMLLKTAHTNASCGGTEYSETNNVQRQTI